MSSRSSSGSSAGRSSFPSQSSTKPLTEYSVSVKEQDGGGRYIISLRKKVGQYQIQQQQQLKRRMDAAYRTYTHTGTPTIKSILSNPFKLRTKAIVESKLKRHIQRYEPPPNSIGHILNYFKNILCKGQISKYNNPTRSNIDEWKNQLYSYFVLYKQFLEEKFHFLYDRSQYDEMIAVHIIKKLIQQAMNEVEKESPKCLLDEYPNNLVKHCFDTLKDELSHTSKRLYQKTLKNVIFTVPDSGNPPSTRSLETRFQVLKQTPFGGSSGGGGAKRSSSSSSSSLF